MTSPKKIPVTTGPYITVNRIEQNSTTAPPPKDHPHIVSPLFTLKISFDTMESI